MKIAIIGAGISGLSVARLLGKQHSVKVYEKSPKIGGIAKTKIVDNVAYHLVGGHCFNSKNKKVMDFVFNEILPKDEWHLVNREAKIYFKNNFIDYPIEFSIKEISKFDPDFAFNASKDFLSTTEGNAYNLADWFEQKFGKTLADEYFIPYNRKIWGKDPKDMSHLWVEGKLPIPNKKQFFQALIGNNKDTMPHSSFYYPNANTQNAFIDALAQKLDITNNFEVKSIQKISTKWLINNELEFDLVINTTPLKSLPFIIKNAPDKIKIAAKQLKYNKVSNMLWKTKDINHTWSYYPEKDTIFHRHIHIGNFFKPKKNYTITECIGEYNFAEMEKAGRKFDYLLEPIDYHTSDYAYVVYDKNYDKATKMIKQYLQEIQLYNVGRFAEWEYFNMDICIESSMNLAASIK